MNQPKILVLLAAHNGERWIQEQLNSILEQRGVTVDVLVSDDGSTDATSTLLHAFSADRRVRITSPPAPTGSAAANFRFLITTAQIGDHDLVALADQDDIWQLDKLISSARLLAAHGAAGYSSAVTAVWENGRQNVLVQQDTISKADFLFEGAGQGCTFVVTHDFYLRIRAFLSTHYLLTFHYHDWAIYALSRVWGLSWYFDPQSHVNYRQHNHNDTGARSSVTGVLMRVRLIRQGWYSQQLAAVARLCTVAAPNDAFLIEWCRILEAPRSLRRRWLLARFCLLYGRRRKLDRWILLVAAIVAWI